MDVPDVMLVRYWSATTEEDVPLEGNVNRAWFVNLTDGIVDNGNKDGLLLVWPVRSAQ